LRWLASRARSIDCEAWQRIGEEVRRAYGMTSPIRLLQTDRSSLLVTWGWRRPTVLLPASAREWSDERIRIVLAHELAHTVRGDWPVQLAAEALRAVYWFNPLLWIVCRRLRVESERACDDLVLTGGIEASKYATHLLAVARSVSAGRPLLLPAPAMARPSSLEGRIRAMLNPGLNRRPVSLWARFASLAALLALTVPIALLAQSEFYSLKGVVLDPTDRILPDSKLILTNSVSAAKYEVKTDAAGRFEFVGLPPASYRLEASQVGFAPLLQDVKIEGNTQRTLRLSVGSLEETIAVDDSDGPIAPPDAAGIKKYEESLGRFAEREKREKARCAEGGADSPVGGQILPPLKLVHVRPVYAQHLRAAKIEGTVTMDAVIGVDGLVRDVQNVRDRTQNWRPRRPTRSASGSSARRF
jgi:hypothetical protein